MTHRQALTRMFGWLTAIIFFAGAAWLHGSGDSVVATGSAVVFVLMGFLFIFMGEMVNVYASPH